VATAEIDGAVCRVFSAEKTDRHTKTPPGAILSAGKEGIEFACGGGESLRITELQAPGKKRMKAADYLLGHPIKVRGDG
jgi:methionyl-tRNA formyltransferase